MKQIWCVVILFLHITSFLGGRGTVDTNFKGLCCVTVLIFHLGLGATSQSLTCEFVANMHKKKSPICAKCSIEISKIQSTWRRQEHNLVFEAAPNPVMTSSLFSVCLYMYVYICLYTHIYVYMFILYMFYICIFGYTYIWTQKKCTLC